MVRCHIDRLVSVLAFRCLPGCHKVNIYLPIAEMSVNVFVLFGMGAGVGFLSGMFGVGGGFLMTPLLIFYNIPPAVAVATEANQIVASSFSGAIAHFRRATVDIKLGMMLLTGGIAGSALGCCDIFLAAQSRSARSYHFHSLRGVFGHNRLTDAD